jgi:hypothetical protein
MVQVVVSEELDLGMDDRKRGQQPGEARRLANPAGVGHDRGSSKRRMSRRPIRASSQAAPGVNPSNSGPSW